MNHILGRSLVSLLEQRPGSPEPWVRLSASPHALSLFLIPSVPHFSHQQNEDNITSRKCDGNESVLVKCLEVLWWKQIMWNQVFAQILIPLSPAGIKEISTLGGLRRVRPWPFIMILILQKETGPQTFVLCCFAFCFLPTSKKRKCYKIHGPQLRAPIQENEAHWHIIFCHSVGDFPDLILRKFIKMRG